MTKISSAWTPKLAQRTYLEARQVKCLTLDEGHVWMRSYDDLPPPVRRRLAESVHNICPACLRGEASRVARRGRPSVSIYFTVIEAIERKLDEKAS